MQKMNYPTWVYFLGLVFILYIFFSLYDPSSSTKKTSPSYQVSASEILQFYKENEAAGDQKYKDKIIEVYGYVTDISSEDIRLNEDVVCNFDENERSKLPSIQKGDRLSIKGECDGKFLWSVQLKHCIVNN